MASGPESQRLFFALWPDDILRHSLYRVIPTRRLRAERWETGARRRISISLWHFFGSLDADGEATRPARRPDGVDAEAFELQLDRLGFWPEPGWTSGWEATQQPVCGTRSGRGFGGGDCVCGDSNRDAKPFVPHVNPGTQSRPSPDNWARLHPLRWPVRDFSNYYARSHMHAAVHYQPLAQLATGLQGCGVQGTVK